MTKRVTSRRRGSYGIDAPFAPAFLVFLLVVEIVLGIISGSVKPFVAALFILAITTLYLYTTLRGKFVEWAKVLVPLHEELHLPQVWLVLGVRVWLPTVNLPHAIHEFVEIAGPHQ